MKELLWLNDNWFTYMLMLYEVNMTSIVIEMHYYMVINYVLMVSIVVITDG